MRTALVLLLSAFVLASAVKIDTGNLPAGLLKYGELPALDVVQHYGYIEVNQQYGANLFYWMFESQGDPSTDPFILWLTGGPGCSSEMALFFENGPWTVNSNLSLNVNPNSWNMNANLLYVDQPAGTGFSYVKNPKGYVHNEKQVAEEMYTFLQTFFQTYPQYAELPFFLTGESYGGHYVPAIGAKIQQMNAAGGNLTINMQGLSIGNGWIDPLIQAGSYGPFAYANSLITSHELTKVQSQYAHCVKDIQEGNYYAAFSDCEGTFDDVLQYAGNINYYDIRLQCNPPPLCYNFNPITNYLNQDSVRQMLGVGDRTWTTCSNRVYTPFEQTDFETSYLVDIPSLLTQYRVLFYNGDLDLICNFYGTYALLNQMSWPGQQEFVDATNTTWTVDGDAAGSYRTAQNLTFFVVANAGHMVPHDQGANALALINSFIYNKPWSS